jgi:hypothetical protein
MDFMALITAWHPNQDWLSIHQQKDIAGKGDAALAVLFGQLFCQLDELF